MLALLPYDVQRVVYKVVQIWPGQTVTCLHTNSPGHIWTTLYNGSLPVSLNCVCEKKSRNASVGAKSPWPGTDPLWPGTLLELFKAQGLLYIPRASKLTNSAFSPQCIYVLRQWWATFWARGSNEERKVFAGPITHTIQIFLLMYH